MSVQTAAASDCYGLELSDYKQVIPDFDHSTRAFHQTTPLGMLVLAPNKTWTISV
jgi:hypothetical protein